MWAHRFREYVTQDASQPLLPYGSVGAFAAFVLCPCPLPAAQHAHAEYVYRVAFECAQAEIARERRARWTTFSPN